MRCEGAPPEDALPIRRLVCLVVVALLAPACSTREPEAPLDAAALAVAPAMLPVGHRAVRAGERLQFDAERPPALRIEGPVPADLRAALVFGAGAVALPREGAEARAGGHLVRFGAPDGAPVGDATLRIEAAGTVLSWPARWDVPPARRAALRALQRDDETPAGALDRMRALVPAMDPEDRAWAAVEVARLARRVEGAEAGIEAWVAAADAATELPSERARRLRAAAFQALWARRFPRALALLDAAEAASATLGALGALDAALDHYYRGLVDREMGRLRAAGAHLEAAVAGLERLGEDAHLTGVVPTWATVLQAQGRHAEALAALERLSPPTEDGARAGWWVTVGWVRLQAMAAGAVPRAVGPVVAQFDEALALMGPAGAADRRANALVNRAWALLLGGDADGAAAALATARAVDPRGTGLQPAFAALLEGRIALARREPAAARGAFGRAVELDVAEAGAAVTDLRWQARHGLARAAEAAGRPAEALVHLRAALVDLDAVTRHTPLQTARARFLADRRGPAEDAARLLLARGEAAEALAVLDAARARVLRTLRATARLDTLDAAAQRAWAERVAAWAEARAAYEGAAEQGEALVGEARVRWQAAQAARAEAAGAAFDAAYAWLEGAAPAAPNGAALQAALAPDEALLAFSTVGETRRGFWVRPRSIEVLDAPAALEATEARLAGVERLYVVDGGWAPARALGARRRAGRALGAQVEIAYLPAAALLMQPSPPPAGAPVVVADPTGDLPHARREGAAVAAALPGARSLVGTAATRDAVLAALDGASWLHYAGHGALRPDDPWSAHLRLTGGARLTLADLLAAAPRMGGAVLSGCETGVAGPLSPHEAIGLPEALLAAGARVVLATDAEVPDADAARVVRAFYAAGGPTRPAAAWRAAIATLDAAGDDAWRSWRLFGRPAGARK